MSTGEHVAKVTVEGDVSNADRSFKQLDRTVGEFQRDLAAVDTELAKVQKQLARSEAALRRAQVSTERASEAQRRMALSQLDWTAAANHAGGSTSKLSQLMSGPGGLAAGFGLVGAGVAGATAVVGELVTQYDAFSQRQLEVGAVFGNLRINLDAARNSTSGLIDDYTLATMANVALRGEVVKTGDEFGVLAGDAVKLGQSVGLNAVDSVKMMTDGLAKMEREVLDNLGVLVSADTAQRKYAASIGKTVTALTQEEKDLAWKREALSQISAKAATVTVKTNEMAESFQRAKVEMSNMYDRMAGAGPRDAYEVMVSLTREQKDQILKLADGAKVYGADLTKAQKMIRDMNGEWVDNAELQALAAKLRRQVAKEDEEHAAWLASEEGRRAQAEAELAAQRQVRLTELQGPEGEIGALEHEIALLQAQGVEQAAIIANEIELAQLRAEQAELLGDQAGWLKEIRNMEILEARLATAEKRKSGGGGRRRKKGDFLDQFKPDSFLDPNAADDLEGEFLEEDKAILAERLTVAEREMELRMLTAELAASGREDEEFRLDLARQAIEAEFEGRAAILEMERAALEERGYFSAEEEAQVQARLAEIAHQEEVNRLQQRMALRAAEVEHQKQMVERERKLYEQRQKTLQEFQSFYGSTWSDLTTTVSMAMDAAGTESKRAERIQRVMRAGQLYVEGAFYIASGTAAMIAGAYLDGGRKLAAGSFALAQAGIMSGEGSLSGMTGGRGGGGSSRPDMPSPSQRSGPMPQAPGSAIPGSRDGRVGPMRTAAMGGGANITIGEIKVLGAIDKQTATKLKQELERVGYSGKVNA